MGQPFSHPILSLTFVAEADLTADRYLAVKAGTADMSIIGASSAGERCLGILDGKPDDEEYGSVVMLGIATAKCGENITYGAPLQTDTDGTLLTAAASDFVIAIALHGGDDGDLIPVFVVAAGVPFDA